MGWGPGVADAREAGNDAPLVAGAGRSQESGRRRSGSGPEYGLVTRTTAADISFSRTRRSTRVHFLIPPDFAKSRLTQANFRRT